MHNSNQDSIALDGPTKVPFRVVVSIPSENNYRLEKSNFFVLINLSGCLVPFVQFVYIRGDPKGIEFQYYRPLLSNESAPNVASKWVTGEWSPCSRTCGKGKFWKMSLSPSKLWKVISYTMLILHVLLFSRFAGILTRDVNCVRSDDETPASLKSCPATTKPESHKPCNIESCTPE